MAIKCIIELSLLSHFSLGDNINLDRLASLTIGMSGADISNIVNQAALAAAKRHKTGVSQEDLEYALDKCKMGQCILLSFSLKFQTVPTLNIFVIPRNSRMGTKIRNFRIENVSSLLLLIEDSFRRS